MAFETIVTGKILANNNSALVGVTVNLNAIKEANTITGYRDIVLVSTGTTDSDGLVQFSGVTAGKYDIHVVSGSTYKLENYEVKNSYVVVPGGSEFVEEQRTFVRSLETLAPSGIMASKEPRPDVHLGYPLDEYAEQFYNVGTVSGNYVNPLNDDPFASVTMEQRNLSNVYFRGNQNLKAVQNFTFKLPA